MGIDLFERYLRKTDMYQLLRELKVPNSKAVLDAIEHLTLKETEKRDKILTGYFGEKVLSLIVDTIGARLLNSEPKMKPDAKILDVGAGSGLFTIKVAGKVKKKLPKASFYAMDVTPIC
jgi:2-polyprenyl-3-methyl-5-hydroxy-6-metoxy-1,4-benzoquinol methylase